jgi:TolB protein
VYDRIARQETRLTDGEQDETHPYWSPNGQAIVYQTNRAGNWDLIILNLDRGEETVLAAKPDDEMYPAYSPNGQQIAFIASPAEGIHEIFVADSASLGVTEITTNSSAANLAWSPDSKSLAYEDTRAQNTDIYIYRLSTKSETRLTETASSEYAPTWDCRGLILYYTLQDESRVDIFQLAITGGEPLAMTVDPAADLWPIFNNPKSFAPSLP